MCWNHKADVLFPLLCASFLRKSLSTCCIFSCHSGSQAYHWATASPGNDHPGNPSLLPTWIAVTVSGKWVIDVGNLILIRLKSQNRVFHLWRRNIPKLLLGIKNRDITLPTKVHLVKALVFPVVMSGCQSWTIKKVEHQRIDTFELWYWRRLQPFHTKGNQSWIFIGRTDVEAGTPILGSPDVKNWLIGKDPNVGKDWRREEIGMTDDDMAGWYHQLNGREFE